MARHDIIARLRLTAVNRFTADAKRAEHAIKEIGNAGNDSGGFLNNLGGALGQLADKVPDLTGRTRIFGFAVGTVATAITALIPLVVGLGGGVVALTGSLGAAALGAGLLGTAVVGAMVPLGMLGLVAMNVFQGLTKVNTAMTAWQTAVKMYGQNSTQAETALARLNAVTELFGGPIVMDAIKAWKDFMRSFSTANRGAMHEMYEIMIELLQAGIEILPAFSKVTKLVAGAMHQAFRELITVLTSSNFQDLLIGMGKSFAAMSGPMMRALTNFLLAFMTISVRLAPAVEVIARGIEHVSQAFLGWAQSGNLGYLIMQFNSWWNLIKAVGGLLFTILKGGANEGMGLVNSLTAVVNKWNEWLKSDAGQKSLMDFFHDAAEMTKAFSWWLARVTETIFLFGKALVPIYTTVFRALVSGWDAIMDALAPAQPFLQNVLIPLLGGLAKGVISGVVGAFKFLVFILKVVSKVFGFLGRILAPLKPVFEVLGHVIGFIFGGAILKVLSNIGRISILLKPLGFMFKMLAIPITAAGKVVGWLLSKLAGLGGWIFNHAYGIFKPFTNAADAVLNFLTGMGSKLFNIGVMIFNKFKDGVFKVIGSGLGFAADLGKAVANAVIGLLNSAIPNSIPVPFAPDIDLPDNPIPQLAGGGVVSGNGSWITGEAGPEINSLRNGKVVVTPLTPSVSAMSAGATLAPGEGSRTIVTKVFLRGRQIAEAVADEADDERARR